MTRISILLTLGALAIGSAGCASGPAKAPDSTGSGPTPGTATSTCKTPEGASAASPPTCAEGCTWNPETALCEEGTRGIIVDEKGDHGNKGGR